MQYRFEKPVELKASSFVTLEISYYVKVYNLVEMNIKNIRFQRLMTWH